MYTLSLSILGHIVLAISCPQEMWTTLRTPLQTDGRTYGQRHTIIRTSNDGRIKNFDLTTFYAIIQHDELISKVAIIVKQAFCFTKGQEKL